MTHEISITKTSLPVAAVGAIILVILGWAAAYYGTVSAQAQSVTTTKDELMEKINAVSSDKDSKIASTNIDLASEKARSDQLEKRLDRFENKLDVLLQHNGVNPDRAALGAQQN